MEIVLGILVGILVCRLWFKGERISETSGTFVIDLTDPVKDICRIELDDSLNTIYSKDRIVLNVKVYEDNSLN